MQTILAHFIQVKKMDFYGCSFIVDALKASTCSIGYLKTLIMNKKKNALIYRVAKNTKFLRESVKCTVIDGFFPKVAMLLFKSGDGSRFFLFANLTI